MCQDSITGIVNFNNRTGNGTKLWQKHYRYCNWQTYHTSNVLMCQDSITGIVIFPITVPVMVKSVAIALPVLKSANLPYRVSETGTSNVHSIN